ncbi:MAG: hypothetical protein CL526_09290 [Aequorivita sp.]|nr:hypothetical protein [Aequorivita sp.]|tara:strand:+ start:14272 stop:14901 length:630 start_codon:yes stop_codon:yes gene_type:complete
MKNILILFALITCGVCLAQNDEAYVDSLVSEKFAELESQQNKEYFSRKDYCKGKVMIFTLPNGEVCTSRTTYYAVYVFWRESENTYKLQKFDNCGSFRPLTIERNSHFKNLLSKVEILKSEVVKPFKAENIEDHPTGNMTVKSCHKEFKFALNGDKFEKKYDEFDLEKESTYRNLNAEYNNSLNLVKLSNHISEIVDKHEESGNFYRER